ncbi:thioredoxin domain-containing protein [Williamsia sp.]|uniref:thioredoxin domain-containing protein n=1 Tax=Williamsia sp. TaxID=1872085 RepID=UPI002F91BFC3
MVTRDSNSLADATSPYLRQHADNPVHWQQWSADALQWARERDVPILLSVGYAACHWCHVMAHESFEDHATATVMNRHFVCIKVDREERPDIDAIYMNATVAMTGQGGWPMTCFLTPEGEPFYCGTYFPSIPRHGLPSFVQLLDAITETWNAKRDEVHRVGAAVAEQLAANAEGLPDPDLALDNDLLAHAVNKVLDDEDRDYGGFGGAPKFPPSALLEGLIRESERTTDPRGLEAAQRTASVMARGGIYDQLAGGFARYAVDQDWVVPHFEKMLYDNAQLLRVYAHLARTTSDPLAQKITEETIGFLQRDLKVIGGFASALDADTEGREGLTYVWTPPEMVDVLGAEDGEWAAQLFNVTAAGTFEDGASTLQLRADPDDVTRFESVRSRLSAARALRPQPGIDGKVVTGWNAMTITALAEAGAGLGRPDWIELAAWCAGELLERHQPGGRLRRSSLDGVAGDPLAMLDDHAALVTALLALYQVTGQPDWRDRGLDLLDRTVDLFADPQAPGSWFDAGADADALLTRPRDPIDGATPAGTSLVAEALLTAAPLAPTSRSPRSADDYLALADDTLARGGVLLAKLPRSAGQWLAVASARLAGPLQIAVSQPDVDSTALLTEARVRAPGGAIVVGGVVDSQPLLDGRPPVDGESAAYICRGTVCGLPVTTVEGLSRQLG